jgi:hypothetical protein
MKQRGVHTIFLQMAVALACLQPIKSFTPPTIIQLPPCFGACNSRINNPSIQRSFQWRLHATSDYEKEEEERKKKVREEIFWAKQRALAAEMNAKSDAAVKK